MLRILPSWLLLSILATVCRAQTDDPLKEHYEAATRLVRSGDQEHAALEYRAFLAEALHRMANGKADAGDFDSSATLFDEALRFAPEDTGLKFDYAKACLDADKLVKARVLAEAVASANPNPETRLLLGRVLFHLGQFGAARGQLERAFAEKPEFNTGYLLGKTYLLLHQEKQARVLFHAMAQEFGDSAQTHIYFGRAYGETDYQDDAVEEFHKAMAKDSRAPDIHYYLGLTYLGHNEAAGYAKAIPEFHAELQRNQSDFRSYYMLGYIALKQRNFSDAESELTAALRTQPSDLQTLLQLAEVYTETNRTQLAESALRKAIALGASHPENEGQISRAHYLLGRLLEKAGRREEALAEMKTVAEIQRRTGPSSMQSADSRTKEAQSDPKAGNGGASEEKLKQLRQFVEGLRPAVADAYNDLGALSAEHQDFSAAVQYFQSARDWDPSIEGLDRNLGRAAFLGGQFQDAVAPLSRYLQQHPDDASIRSALGLSFFHLAEYQKVIDVLSPIALAIQSNPELSNAYTVSLSKTAKK